MPGWPAYGPQNVVRGNINQKHARGRGIQAHEPRRDQARNQMPLIGKAFSLSDTNNNPGSVFPRGISLRPRVNLPGR